MANLPYLIEDKPFTEGADFTPGMFDLISHVTYGDNQYAGLYIGYRPGLKDENLSDLTSEIKYRFNSFQDSLKVVHGTLPLTIKVLVGGLHLQDQSPITKETTQYTVPDGAVSYVYIDPLGDIQVGPTPTPVSCILARVTASGGEIGPGGIQNWGDIIYRHRVQPRADIVNIFGGNGGEGDLLVTSGNSLTLDKSLYSFRNVTIQSGATVYIDKFAILNCSGNFSNAGSIFVSQATSGSAIFALPFANNFILGSAGFGVGGGGGSSGLAGKTYSYAMQAFGSGGGSGVSYGTSGGAAIAAGGFGGGGLIIQAAGDLLNTGLIEAKGANASAGIDTIPVSNGGCSGAGGGSGGLVYLASLKSVVSSLTSTINVSAGNGSNGVAFGGTTTKFAGGTGGGGGQLVCVCPVINLTGATINLNGGVGGSHSAPNPGVGGGVGGGYGGESAGNAGNTGNLGRLILRLFTPQPL